MTTTRTVRFSESHSVHFEDKPEHDIDVDKNFLNLFHIARDYSMTSKDTMYALYSAVNYILDRNIEGDFVECGVWKGGSSLLTSLIFQQRGVQNRAVYLFDTFEGMTPATEDDVDYKGNSGSQMMEDYSDQSGWCYAHLEKVQETFAEHHFDFPVNFVKGDVVQTLKREKPEQISILRLDTDWYESTMEELVQLYPRLSIGGVLVIDDYGYWEGARKATDEYFRTVPAPLIIRVNHSVRLAIKI